MNETTAQQLRRTILEIRRKPYPIKDLIPLLDKAATELEGIKDHYTAYQHDKYIDYDSGMAYDE